MAALVPRVDPRIESMFEFIETHAGITYRNLQLFYGDLILQLGVNEDDINAECTRKGISPLSPETEDSDYIFEAPINAFDGGDLPPLSDPYVAGIIAKVKRLPPLRPIEFNKRNTDFSTYLPMSLDDFRGSIPKLQTTYTKIKGNEKTSKVREMLDDFQPMFLERFSNFILDLLKVGGARVFTTMTEFIRAFTDPEFAVIARRLGEVIEQMKPTSEEVWEGKFGGIHLIIHVVPNRQPTGKGNTISAANVIQAAVFYKDRKNDFVRGQGALTMIQDCKTHWPNGVVSHKNGTLYYFSDLYTGELVVQNYTGTLPDFPDNATYADGIKVKVKGEVPFVIDKAYYDDAFVSVLPMVHEASAAKKIFTNQEHIFAVYPASCAFHDRCYYETLIQNLQMISAIANSEVNYETYESPLGKIQFVYDSHQTNLKRNIGPWWAKRIELFLTAMRVCPTREFHDKIYSEAAALQSKITEIEAENTKNAPKLASLTKSSKTKDELKEFAALTQLKQSNDANIAILMSVFKNIQPVAPSPDPEQFAIHEKKYLDFIREKEFHTRKAMLMKRLATLEECALAYDENEALILHRRSVVMSCIHSVGIIVECAKIGVSTTTVSTSEHKRLVKESKNVTALRKLSARLFSDYQQYKSQLTEVSTLVQVIEPMLELVEMHDKLKEGIKIALVDNVVLRYKGIWGDLLAERGKILEAKLDELDARVEAGEDYQAVRREQEEKYAPDLARINANMLAAIAKMDEDYSNVSYLLENLSELGSVHSVDLFRISQQMNGVILQLLNQLLTVPSIFNAEQKGRMTLLLEMITRTDQSTVLATHYTDRSEKEKEVVVEHFGVGLKENVNTVHGLLPEGVSYKSAVNVAMTLIGNEPDLKTRRKKGFSYNDRLIVSQAEQAKLDSRSSSTPTAGRLSNRVSKIAAAQKADAASDELEVTKRTKEADAMEGLLYMYHFTNEPKKPTPAIREQIVAAVNANGEISTAARDLMRIMATLAGPFQQNTTGKLSMVEQGVPAVRSFNLSPVGPRGGGKDFSEQMNAAISSNEIPTMYDLYIDHFDSENDYDTCILLNQAYCILMKQSIYVPLYRCETTKTIEEMIVPMLEKRRDYHGDLYDFDSTFADSFCIQLFGKNVNELLDDLSKGSLNVPRGAFPNISANPFEPVSLICILETVLFLCKGLPFATRLHVYFAGVLSFMNQTYDRNMDVIQTDEILNYLKDPSFFQCFHEAARMYNERYGMLSAPEPELASEPLESEAEPPEPSLEPPVPALEPSEPLEPPVPEPPVPEPPVPPESAAEPELPALLPPIPLKIDPTSVSHPPGTTPPSTPGGGTRRYRRYKQKTKRHTLNKRFKKNRTRRLHGLRVRD